MNPAQYLPASYTSADIAAAIATADAAGGGIVELPAGIYDADVVISGAPHVTVRGSGCGATIVRMNAARDGYVFNGLGKDGFGVEGLTVDMGNFLSPTDGGGVAHFGYDPSTEASGAGSGTGGVANFFSSCEIIGLRRYGVVVHNGSRRIEVLNNKIQSDAPINGEDTGGISNIGIMFRPHAGGHFFGKISGNRIDNLCGISAALHTGEISSNIVRGSGFGANIAIEDDPLCYGIRIVANETSYGTTITLPNGSLHEPSGIEVWGAHHEVSINAANGNAGQGLSLCGRDIRAIGNTCTGNGHAGIWVHSTASAITLISNSTANNTGGATQFNGVPVRVIAANDFA